MTELQQATIKKLKEQIKSIRRWYAYTIKDLRSQNRNYKLYNAEKMMTIRRLRLQLKIVKYQLKERK